MDALPVKTSACGPKARRMFCNQMFIARYIFLIVLLTAIAALHAHALKFNIYWTVWWYDIPMHFLGGVWTGFLGLVFIYRNRSLSEVTLSKKIYYALLSAIVAGIIWEIFEYHFGLYGVSKNFYIKDTAKDLVTDMLGGVTVPFLLGWLK